jgi:hypothetical protein
MHVAIIVAFLIQMTTIFFLSWSPHVAVFIIALMIRGSAAGNSMNKDTKQLN